MITINSTIMLVSFLLSLVVGLVLLHKAFKFIALQSDKDIIDKCIMTVAAGVVLSALVVASSLLIAFFISLLYTEIMFFVSVFSVLALFSGVAFIYNKIYNAPTSVIREQEDGRLHDRSDQAN